MLSLRSAEPGRPLRVGVIGFGAIGRPVVDALDCGRVDGARLAGVVSRTAGVTPRQLDDVEALVSISDLIVEAAGHQAVRDHAVGIMSSGTDFLTVSSGALADPALRREVEAAGPGRLWICPGAVGGLDLLRTVRHSGQPFVVRLTSTKDPAAFAGAPLDAAVRTRLGGLADDHEVVVFRGCAQEAATRFPANANVAATLALAAGDWERVEVTLMARAGQALTHHQIDIESAVGTYRISLRNQPAPGNPATSGLVALALLRCLTDRIGGGAVAFL